MQNKLFNFLNKTFKENGFFIFEVGGSVRDEILGLEVYDFDFATNATPEEMTKFLPDAIDTFAKYGCIKYKGEHGRAEITTFRVEEKYDDFRHPAKIRFVKSLEEDYLRRDFTINAIYKDIDGNIYDPAGGVEDIKNKLIRFIGEPKKRIKEDPLRILRAKRFATKLGFEIESETAKAMEKLSYLLEKLNPDKIKEEERKSK
jgi:tRNA nucleotidyltransferase (CCA-adding enzyme)